MTAGPSNNDDNDGWSVEELRQCVIYLYRFRDSEIAQSNPVLGKIFFIRGSVANVSVHSASTTGKRKSERQRESRAEESLKPKRVPATPKPRRRRPVGVTNDPDAKRPCRIQGNLKQVKINFKPIIVRLSDYRHI